MHPYRTSSPPEPDHEDTGDHGLRLAIGVMTFVGAVQVAIALPHSGPPSTQTMFGGACFIAGLAWLLRHCQR